MLSKKLFICSLLALNIFGLSGCQSKDISSTAELSGNIALTQHDTALRLNKIATNVTSSESGFSSLLIKMIQTTTNVTDDDYQSLSLKISSALNTIESNLTNIDNFTCPSTMIEKRDNVRASIESYKAALTYIKSACEEKDVNKLKIGYEQYISAISSIQSSTASLT